MKPLQPFWLKSLQCKDDLTICHLLSLRSTSKPWTRICKSLPTQDLGNRAKSQSQFVKLIEYSKKKFHTYLLKPKCKFVFPLRTLCSCFQKVDIYLHKCFLKESWIFMCAYASILKVLGRLKEEEKLFSLRQNKIMLVWSWVRNLPDTNSQNAGGSLFGKLKFLLHHSSPSEKRILSVIQNKDNSKLKAVSSHFRQFSCSFLYYLYGKVLNTLSRLRAGLSHLQVAAWLLQNPKEYPWGSSTSLGPIHMLRPGQSQGLSKS